SAFGSTAASTGTSSLASSRTRTRRWPRPGSSRRLASPRARPSETAPSREAEAVVSLFAEDLPPARLDSPSRWEKVVRVKSCGPSGSQARRPADQRRTAAPLQSLFVSNARIYGSEGVVRFDATVAFRVDDGCR